MALNIVRVNALPDPVVASTIYTVKSSTSGLVDIYVTDNTGTEIRTLPNAALAEVGANPPIWVAGMHAEGVTVYSPSNYQTYRRTASLPENLWDLSLKCPCDNTAPGEGASPLLVC